MAETFQVKLSGGETLRGHFWPAASPARNLTVITGMDEYSLRYDRFARYLASRNTNVWVLDAFGQGLNARSVEEQEQWPKMAFIKNVDAIHRMILLARENGLPTCVMGHSMGSFMVQSLLERYPNATDGVVICGSNGGQHALMCIAYRLAKFKVNDANWNDPCPLLQNLGLGGYTKAVKDRKTDFDWLSYDEENVAAYIADPYCGHWNTGGFWLEFLRGMTTVWHSGAMRKISPDERIFIIAGEDDPVGRNGSGPKWLASAYQKLGVKDVALKLYPRMRHEILNEADHETVYQDIFRFISGE